MFSDVLETTGGPCKIPLDISELAVIQELFVKTGAITEKFCLTEAGQAAEVLIIRAGGRHLSRAAQSSVVIDIDRFWAQIECLGTVDKKSRGTRGSSKKDIDIEVQLTNQFEDSTKALQCLDVLLPEQRLSQLCATARFYPRSKSDIRFLGDQKHGVSIGLYLAREPLDSQGQCIQWQVFHNSVPVGQRVVKNLFHGDMFFMTGRASGLDWNLRARETVRHRIGCEQWLSRNEKLQHKKWCTRTQVRIPSNAEQLTSYDDEMRQKVTCRAKNAVAVNSDNVENKEIK